MSFSKEEKGKGRATPQTNDAVIPAPATSSSIVSRAAASAWGLTQNVFTKPAEALLESSSTMPYGGTEKGQFHNVGSSRGDIGPSLPLSVLEASRQKTTQLDNLSFRTQDLEPSYKSPEVEMEEEAFLAPPPLPERKRKSHFWIDDYNRLKHTWNPNEEDGAEVVSLLSDPSFSPLDESLYLPNSETKPDIPPDLFTRDIPPHALSILEGLKRLLPPPPIHQPASVFDLLSLCSSASPLTRSGEFSDGASQWSDVDLNSAGSLPSDPYQQWLAVNQTYAKDVWLDTEIYSLAQDVPGKGKEVDHQSGQLPERAVERLGMMLAHLAHKGKA